MNGNKRVNAQFALQSHKQCFLQVAARWNDRQKMRLVHDHKLLILKQNDFIKWNTRLYFKSAVVINSQARFKRARGRDRYAMFIHNISGGHAKRPFVRGNCGELLRKKMSDSSSGKYNFGVGLISGRIGQMLLVRWI